MPELRFDDPCICRRLNNLQKLGHLNYLMRLEKITTKFFTGAAHSGSKRGSTTEVRVALRDLFHGLEVLIC